MRGNFLRLEVKNMGSIFSARSGFITGLKVEVCTFNVGVDALGMVQPSKS